MKKRVKQHSRNISKIIILCNDEDDQRIEEYVDFAHKIYADVSQKPIETTVIAAGKGVGKIVDMARALFISKADEVVWEFLL
jgi:ribose 5-phosphate isomerase RpiB